MCWHKVGLRLVEGPFVRPYMGHKLGYKERSYTPTCGIPEGFLELPGGSPLDVGFLRQLPTAAIEDSALLDRPETPQRYTVLYHTILYRMNMYHTILHHIILLGARRDQLLSIRLWVHLSAASIGCAHGTRGPAGHTAEGRTMYSRAEAPYVGAVRR